MNETQIVAKNLTSWMAITPSLSTLQKVAGKSGVGFGTVRRMKNGEGNPTRESLSKVARAFERTADDLLRPVESNRNELPGSRFAADEIIIIPYLLAPASAAGSEGKHEYPEIRSSLGFSREWLKKMGLTPEALRFFVAAGDSMSPYIKDGDMLLVDTSAIGLKSGEVWVFSQEPPLGHRVKRALLRENGDLIMRSDNADKFQFPDEVVALSEIIDARGKVVWRGG